MQASRFLRRSSPALLSAAVACGGAAYRSEAAPALSLAVSCPDNAAVGEPIDVSVRVSAIGGELTDGYPFRLRTDSGAPVELGLGDALHPEDDAIVFSWSSSFDASGPQTLSGMVHGCVCTETRCVEIAEPFSCGIDVR